MNYKDLDVWILSNEIVLEIHKMTIRDLPPFEMYETGSQIRRSSKSVKSNIVEGFGRRRSKKEFLLFLRISLASNDETLDHLETLYNTRSFTNKATYENLARKIEILGKKLNLFIQSVEKNHRS